MHTTIPIQHVAYKIIFYTIDAFQIWNDQLGHPKGWVKNYWQFFWSRFSQSMATISDTGKQILRPSYLKIRLNILDSLTIFKRICVGLMQRLYGQFRHFMVVKIVAPGFKNKTRYAPYVSPGNQISHIAINKGNINRQCLNTQRISIENITSEYRQRKDNSDLLAKTLNPQGQLTG